LDEYLGYIKFEIGHLVGSKDNHLEFDILGGKIGLSKEDHEILMKE
jgi:hypothetical protein